MLFALRDYLAQEKCLSIELLARKFKINPQALLPMLDIWVARGVLQVDESQQACVSGCGGCQERLPIYYRYVGE